MKNNKRTFLAVLLLIGICGTILSGCAGGSAKVDLNDYVVIKESGYNGYGSIEEYSLDYEALVAKYASHATGGFVSEEGAGFEIESDDGGMIQRYSFADATTIEEAAAEMLRSYTPKMEVKDLAEGENLTNKCTFSNGDKITFTWDFDEDNINAIEKIFNIRICYSDFSYKLKDLKELLKVDPFEKVVLYLIGKNGTGRTRDLAHAYISYGDNINEEIVQEIKIEQPQNNGSLSNGDTLHATVAEFDSEELATEYGIVFTRTEADISVHGLNAYGQPGASNGKKATVNLNDYVNCTTGGRFEGEGCADTYLEYEKLLRDYMMSFSENVAEEDLFGYESSKYAAYYLFKDNSPFKIIKKSSTDAKQGLNNGDVVNLSWEVNKENLAKLQKVMNVEFTYSDFSYTIEGLEKLRKIDLFEDYKVFYEGTNGSGRAYGYVCYSPFAKDPSIKDEVELDIISDKNGSLSNGDKIIISLKHDTDSGYFLTNWGIVPTRTELEVIVSGLN